jgi:hypothetical protein
MNSFPDSADNAASKLSLEALLLPIMQIFNFLFPLPVLTVGELKF